MNTPNIQSATSAPSVTIAPRNPARGVLTFVVTLTDHQKQSVYPCRTIESATKLATRFAAGLLRHSAAKANVTKSVR